MRFAPQTILPPARGSGPFHDNLFNPHYARATCCDREILVTLANAAILIEV